MKFELMKLNRSLWLGDLLHTVDLAIPIDSEFMHSEEFGKQPLINEMLQEYRGSELLYH